MSKFNITVTKQEVEQAVLGYINHSVTINGRRELKAPTIYFTNKDGDISYFDCHIEIDENTETTEPES